MLSDRFKRMYRQLGFDRAAVAQLLRVSERTLHNWESGKHEIPYSAYKLLRLLSYSEMPGKAWEGWHFSAGRLWSPEGYGFRPEESSWWSLLCRRAAGFDQLYKENVRLRDLAHLKDSAAGCGAAPAEAFKKAPVSSEVLVTLHQSFSFETETPKTSDQAEGPKSEVMQVTPHQTVNFDQNTSKTWRLPCPAQVRYKGIKPLFAHTVKGGK